MLRRILLVLWVLSCHTFLYAQNEASSEIDSLLTLPKVNPTVSTFTQLTEFKDTFYEMPDVLEQIQRQIQSRRDLISYQDLGTHFSPLFNLEQLYTPRVGFNLGNPSLDAFLTEPASRPFYNAPMPFTRFRYAQGGAEYIQFDALHTQNIIPSWNVAAGIQSFTNRGLAVRQLQVHRAPYITTHFTHPNNKLRILGSFNWTRRSGYVSGGLNRFDSIGFGNVNTNQIDSNTSAGWYNLLDPGVSRNSLDPGLTAAFDTVRIAQHRLRIQYQMGPKYFDTLDSFSFIQPLFGLYSDAQLRKQTWIHEYNEEDLNYYEQFFGTARRTFLRDSISFLLYDQRVGFQKHRIASNGFGLSAFAGFQSGNYIQRDAVSFRINNLYIGGNLEIEMPGNLQLKSNAQLFLSGYNGGDYHLNAVVHKSQEAFDINAGLNSGLYEPAPQQVAFVTPVIQLINQNLSKTNNNLIFGNILWKKFKNPLLLGVSVQNVGNLLYYNSNIELVQSNSAIQQTKLTIGKLFRHKTWNLRLDGFAQQITGNSDIALPTWGLKADAYYRRTISDSALDFKAGLDVFIHNQFNALGYMPMLRQFYFQGGEQLGGYPLLDVYVSGKMKTFIFFAKMENILDFYFVQRSAVSQSTYSYPMQPMAFRLGFKWDFYL